jgi:hypothetical protein
MQCRRLAFTAHKVKKRQHRMPHNHARACVAHDEPDLFPHVRLVTMHGTAKTRWLVGAKTASPQPVVAVDKKMRTIRAQPFLGLVDGRAVQADHYLDCAAFLVLG